MTDPYSTPDPYSSSPASPGSSAQQPYQGYSAPSGAPQPPAAQPNQPTPPQYQQQGYPQQQYPQYAPEVPGKTMGIVGFILAFVLAPAGIVVSAIGLSQSKKAGVPNTLGTWGLWLSIVFTALWLIGIGIWFVAFWTLMSTAPTVMEYSTY